jgi:hypothetical protein
LIIASKLAMAAFSRIEIEEEKRNDFYLYIDEFHNLQQKAYQLYCLKQENIVYA